MFTHRCRRSGRRPGRTLVRAGALGLFLALTTTALPAFADAPAAWPRQPHVSGLDFLLVLLFIPLAIGVVITVLVVLPSLIQGEKYDPTKAWQGTTKEWFGGPRKGIEEPPRSKPEDTGGAGARW